MTSPQSESKTQRDEVNESNNSENEWEVQRDQEKTYGDNAFRAGDLATAIHHYSQALSLDPQHHILLSNRSAAYLKSHQKSKALHDARACVDCMPKSFSKGYSRLAAALQSLGRFEQAAEAWTKLLSLDPSNAVGLHGLSECKKALESSKTTTEDAEAQADVDADGKTGNEKEENEDDLDDFFNDVEEAAREATKIPVEEEDTSTAKKAISNHKVTLGDAKSQIDRLLQPNYKWRNLNPFYVLDIPHTSSSEDISRRYKALSLLLHPDKNRGKFENAEEAYDQVQKAKSMLLGDESKAKHVRNLAEQGFKQGYRDWEKQKKEQGKVDSLEDFRFRAVQKIFAQVEFKRQEVEKRERKQREREQQQEEEELQKERDERQFEKKFREEERVGKRVGNWRSFQKEKKGKLR